MLSDVEYVRLTRVCLSQYVQARGMFYLAVVFTI